MNPRGLGTQRQDRSRTRLRVVQPVLSCPICGDEGIVTVWHHHTFEYGTGEAAASLQARVPVRRCDPCDLEYLDEEAERLKHMAICEHLGVLAPEDIRKIRQGSGMTRAAFADASGLGEASLNRWENGLSIQSHSNDRYLRLLAYPEIMTRLQELTSRQGPKTRPADDGARRFRCVELNEVMEKKQQAFQLRMAG